MSGWKSLDVAIIGGGIGGLSAAIALRRAGHSVTIYERSDYAGEVGSVIACAANGTRWLHEWDVDMAKGDPVVLKKLINRDWETGAPVSVSDLAGYEERWGHAYNLFHRRNMHIMLKDAATREEGKGKPAQLLVNHKCREIDLDLGKITFENGSSALHDLVIGADGIGSAVRAVIGIKPNKRPADSSCLHANVLTSDAVKAGLVDYSQDSAIQYWGGQEGKWDRIVVSPCDGGKLLSYYCFFPREKGDYTNHAWGGKDRAVEELLRPYPHLDPQLKAHLAIGEKIQPWRLWVHDAYPYIHKKNVCLLGDAAHPMMPHQGQGACMAIEDAAALGILFSQRHFDGDVEQALRVYDKVRLPRVTRVQAAAAKASYNINERIGFSMNKDCATYKVEDTKTLLTMEEINIYDIHRDIEEKLAGIKNQMYCESFICGMPIGLKLPNGTTIGV